MRVTIVVLAIARATLGSGWADARPALDAAALPGAALVGPEATWRWQVLTVPVDGPGRATPRAGAVPARWPDAVEGGARAIPLAAADERIAAAFGVTSFTLTEADQGLAMLELRARYTDGLAAWLNGVELVRAALPRGGPTLPASRPHGPEWQTFYVPVGPGLLRLGANQLAIEVRPSGRRTAPTAEIALVGRRERGLVRGPILAELEIDRATITVETDPGTAATLAWGRGAVLDRRVTSPPGRVHRFALDGLPARGGVRYRVDAGATSSAVYTFHTPPRAGEVVRIGVYGDARGGHATHRAIVEAMLDEALDLVASTGDLVLRGADEADWQRFFAVLQPLLAQVPYLPVIGNHDLGWSGAEPAAHAREAFALRAGPAARPAGTYWYSHDLADLHLVFLDSNAYERVEQVTWLEADLAAARARGVRAILVLTHHGPYSRGPHGGHALARARYVPILARHAVDLVLSGHDHLYQRGEVDGLRYVVTGGGGASLYPSRCGGSGQPACAVDDGLRASAREHHYLVLTVGREAVQLCPRRPSGRLLEPCTRYPLRPR